jgi:hypothetical protein
MRSLSLRPSQSPQAASPFRPPPTECALLLCLHLLSAILILLPGLSFLVAKGLQGPIKGMAFLE